ncbi:MAG: hypothetical protein J5966_10435 [Lachnospiraceae bacterium]|nr:hypothetical protein [Lachnospiraceae bacterium]
MGKNRKNKADVLIDVTSLLDVVFIILLIVITQISGMQTSAGLREEEAAEAIKEAETQQKIYRDQIDSQKNVDQYVEFISVVSTYDPDILTERSISVHFPAEDSVRELVLKGEAVDDVYGEFSQLLREHIADNPEKLIVLSLNENDEDILYRDEKRIQGIFTDLLTYSNVRIKSADGADI